MLPDVLVSAHIDDQRKGRRFQSVHAYLSNTMFVSARAQSCLGMHAPDSCGTFRRTCTHEIRPTCRDILQSCMQNAVKELEIMKPSRLRRHSPIASVLVYRCSLSAAHRRSGSSAHSCEEACQVVSSCSQRPRGCDGQRAPEVCNNHRLPPRKGAHANSQ